MTAAAPALDGVAVERQLAAYGAVVAEAIDAALPAGDGAGGLWALAGDYPRRGGKAIRPSLCLATCVAFGGEPAEALPSATAIELLHNAFLVHDDVEDASEQRRGRPTLHVEHGLAAAVNAGDALATLAHRVLQGNRPLLGGRLAALVGDEFDDMARRTVEGQALELAWRDDTSLTLGPDDYLDLIMRKTCWYTTIHPMRVGALIGSWGRADLDPLVRFGFYLGAAFQIQDDLLNLEGEEQAYGKECCGDLYEGKRTLMLIHLLAEAPPADRAEVLAFLGRDRAGRTAADVAHVRDLMVQHGSLVFARAFGEGIAGAAEAAFEEAFAGVPDGEERRFVHAMIGWMLDRRR